MVLCYLMFPKSFIYFRTTKSLITNSKERVVHKILLLDQLEKNNLFLTKLKLLPNHLISEYEFKIAETYFKKIYSGHIRSFAECSGEYRPKWDDGVIRDYVKKSDEERLSLFKKILPELKENQEESFYSKSTQILRDIKNLHEKLNSNTSGSYYKNSLELESMFNKSESNSGKHTILSQLEFILNQLKLEDDSNTSKEERYLINQLNINERYLTKLKDLEVS